VNISEEDVPRTQRPAVMMLTFNDAALSLTK